MRLNFEFSDERVQDLKVLLSRSKAETMKDLVNNALTILEWTIDETEAGNEIAAINEEKQVYRVLITPILQGIARKSKEDPTRVAAAAKS